MPVIDDYSFGRMVIDGKTYTSDVIVFPDHVQSSWWREEGHRLSLKDIEDVLVSRPEVLVVGTGSFGAMKVPAAVSGGIKEQGIELIVEKTAVAVRTYNQLSSGKRVIGAFHLTC